jgi:hypothetical protein
MRIVSFARVLTCGACSAILLLLSGCAAERSPHKALKDLRPPAGSQPIMLAVYEPWFGDRDHIDVGYSSHDVVVLQKQVEQAKDLGLGGFLVDWYGNKKPYMDKTFALMQQVAHENGFQVALMYDEIVTDPESMTEDAIANLDYAHKNYIAASAPHSAAYIRYKDRPVIFIWPKGGRTDWARVRQHVDQWPEPPLLIYKDEKSPHADAFDGVYAWIHPGEPGWQKDGSNWGEQYLDRFYSRMKRENPGKIVVGAAWPGFDDRRASWSENRYMDRRCGRTFEQTLSYHRRYFDEKDPLPFMLIATWNDHEEGTAIERGIARAEFEPKSGNCSDAD